MCAAFKDRYTKALERKSLWLGFACLFAVAIICVALFSVKHYDRFALLAFSVLIISCFVPSTQINIIFKSSIWVKLGGITFEMLLVHCPIIWVVNNLTYSVRFSQIGIWGLAILYMTLVLVCSVVLKLIGNKFNKITK